MSEEMRKERQREKGKRWREKNRDEILARRAEWRKANREKLNGEQRQRRQKDPEKYRQRWREWYDRDRRPADEDRKFRSAQMIANDIERQMKVCSKCRTDLPFEAFYRHPTSPDSRVSRCKACVTERSIAYAAEQRALDPEGWQLRRQAARYASQYGISAARYLELLEEQGGACAICRRPPTARRLSVDHNHQCCPARGSCGSCVRGLLCDECNNGIGRFGDDPKRLRAAIRYLAKY